VKTKIKPLFLLPILLGVIFLTFSGCVTPSPKKQKTGISLPVSSQDAAKQSTAQKALPQPSPTARSLDSGKTINSDDADLRGDSGANQPPVETTADDSPGSTWMLTDEEIPDEAVSDAQEVSPSISADKQEAAEAPPTTSQPPEKTNQELLDQALEFCQASNDYWKRGNLDDALDALDQAYDLILKVNPDDNPELLQQREDLRFTIAKRIIEVYSSRLTAVNGYHKAIQLHMNQYVKNAIKVFQGKERTFFLESYKRSGRYRPFILKALRKAGLPEELSWLPLIESGFKVRAFSKARALGLWQFIASTGYKYGLERDRWVDERMDPEKATQAAISYLKELHQIFGDWTTALAAYNCGEGTVLKCIRTQRANYLDNFWDLYEKLPRETASYVPRFLATLHIIQKPKQYGFTLPPVYPPFHVEKVTVDKPVHLKNVAKATGVSYEQLLELNPELKRHSTPARSYDLNMPSGTGKLLIAKLSSIPKWTPQIPEFVYHRVRKGEVLSFLAKRYHTSVTAIMRLNRLRSSRYLRVGWRLKIPVGRRYVQARQLQEKREIGSSTSFKGEKKYVVRKGDSLWRIANRFNTTTDAIKKANNLRTAHLSIGQMLIIRGEYGSQEAAAGNARKYRVRAGDSPYVIAQRHQMDLSEFLQLNRLTPRSTIFPGQIVLVKSN
jgi:membrane-bound lytic murein transglycosylase D